MNKMSMNGLFSNSIEIMPHFSQTTFQRSPARTSSDTAVEPNTTFYSTINNEALVHSATNLEELNKAPVHFCDGNVSLQGNFINSSPTKNPELEYSYADDFNVSQSPKQNLEHQYSYADVDLNPPMQSLHDQYSYADVNTSPLPMQSSQEQTPVPVYSYADVNINSPNTTNVLISDKRNEDERNEPCWSENEIYSRTDEEEQQEGWSDNTLYATSSSQ